MGGMGSVLVYRSHVSLFKHSCKVWGLEWTRLGTRTLLKSAEEPEPVEMVQYGFSTVASVKQARKIVDLYSIGI